MGRFDFIHSSEGNKIGLTISPTLLSKVDEYGNILTPYYKVIKGVIKTNKIYYFSNYEDYKSFLASSDINVDKNNKIIEQYILVRHQDNFKYIRGENVDFVGVSNFSCLCTPIGLIPFAENTSPTRLMTGSNMYKQALPLLFAERPYVLSGLEKLVSKYDFGNIYSEYNGTVIYVDSKLIILQTDKKKKISYTLQNFYKKNNKVPFVSIPNVKINDTVKIGDRIATDLSTKDGYLALGRNLNMAIIPKGLETYEDGLVISDELLHNDGFTHLESQTFTLELRETELSSERFTNKLPEVSPDKLTQLNENGLVRVGEELKYGDVIIGRTTPVSFSNTDMSNDF